MIFAVISFTENGVQLSRRAAEGWKGDAEVQLYTKYSGYLSCSSACDSQPDVVYVREHIQEWAGHQMEDRKALVFIGACGIAVRAIAAHITDKFHDSPVLVMDEQGSFVIPILSGHMGGANELAVLLAEKLGAAPVITTATDLNQRFAVDLFARKNHLWIENKDGIARTSAKALAGKKMTISIQGNRVREADQAAMEAKRLQLVPYPPAVQVDILITSEKPIVPAGILLRPKTYVLGIGCKKGKEADRIADFAERMLQELGIRPEQVYALASIDRKAEEAGILAWSRRHRIPFFTFSQEELERVEGEFHESEFVRSAVGIGNVCERAALAACGSGGILIREKYAEDGMTLAAAKREWSVRFDEE